MADDSVEPLITECPSCHTRFRVTEAQLTVASGRVRCGACKNVFRGADHLVLSMDAPRSTEDPDAALDALLNELSQVSTKHEPRRPEPTPVPRVVREAPDERRPSPPPSPIGHEPRVTVMRDVPRRRLRRGSQPIPPPPRPRIAGDDAAAPVTNEVVEGRSGAPAVAPSQAQLERASDAAVPSAPAVERPSATAAEPSSTPAELPPLPEVSEEPVVPVEAKASAPAGEEGGSPPAREPARARSTPHATPVHVEEIVLAEHSSPAPFASVDAPRRDPVRLPVDPLGLGDPPFGLEEGTPRRSRWWVAPAIVVGLVALAGQVLWFQFATWARDPEIRPVYEWLCAGLGCELPIMRALDAFHTKNLVVRAHPEKAGALAVDAIIVNDASFAQPFPEIELRFSAIGGNLVAARRFSPAEYLAGDAAGSNLIGPHTPVHIALDIEDPGADAVNYIITFR